MIVLMLQRISQVWDRAQIVVKITVVAHAAPPCIHPGRVKLEFVALVGNVCLVMWLGLTSVMWFQAANPMAKWAASS